MKAGWAALGLLLAVSARADMAIFNAQRLGQTYSNACVSANGYHYAVLVSGKKNDQFIVDGRTIAQAAPGALGGSLHSDCALSDDGKALLHVMAAPSSQAHAGVVAAMNGKPLGAVVQDVSDLNLSPDHTFAAFVAHTAGGYQVVSSRGNGPLMETPPSKIIFGPSSIYFLQNWKGTYVIYRDSAPLASGAYQEIAAPPDLSRLAASRAGASSWSIELDGKTQTIPLPRVTNLTFSANGRHFGYFHGQEVVIDGRTGPAPTHDELGRAELTLAPDGIPYWTNGTKHGTNVLRSGKIIGTVTERLNIGFSPKGSHSVLFALTRKTLNSPSQALIDGKSVMAIPDPLGTYLDSPHNTRPVFDSEEEFHFMSSDGDRIELVCVSLGKASARRGPCAQTARRLGLKARTEQP